MLWLYIGFIFYSWETTDAVQLPSEIQRCSLSDPAIDSCMAKGITKALQLFKRGYKDFGIPVLEPLEIKKLEIGADSGKSVTLNQHYENVKLYRVTDSEVVKFSMKNDSSTCVWEMEVHTPLTRMEADYSLKGQILVFPINGHGKCNITLYNVVNRHKTDCEYYTKKGKLYERLKNYQMDMSLEKCTFKFENLFPGNDRISQELEKTINENSLEIFQEVKHGFEEVLSKLHENGANSVLSRIPLNELYLP